MANNTKMERAALWLNDKLPIYRYYNNGRLTKVQEGKVDDTITLAIWNCGYIADRRSLWKTLRDIRITLRKNGRVIWEIKKGAI